MHTYLIITELFHVTHTHTHSHTTCTHTHIHCTHTYIHTHMHSYTTTQKKKPPWNLIIWGKAKALPLQESSISSCTL